LGTGTDFTGTAVAAGLDIFPNRQVAGIKISSFNWNFSIRFRAGA